MFSMRAPFGFIRGVAAIILLADLSVVSQSAFAQSDSNGDVEQRLRKLEKTVGDLNVDTRKLEVAEEEQQKAKAPASWTLKDGFLIQSSDGAYKLKVGGYLHGDGRFFLHNNVDANKSQFTIR